MSEPRLCQRCGGTGAEHGLISYDGCGCESCAKVPVADRCRAFWFEGSPDPLTVAR